MHRSAIAPPRPARPGPGRPSGVRLGEVRLDGARLVGVLVALALAAPGCSGLVADVVAGSGSGPSVFATDDDPQIVREAVPTFLKTMEMVLGSEPDHEGLLLQLCKGYTQYAYAFVLQDAEIAEEDSFREAQALRARGKKLLLRARDYCLTGLESVEEGFVASLDDADARAAMLAELDEDEVPLLFWGAASWAAAVSVGKDDPQLLSDLATVADLIDRAEALEPCYDKGAVHELQMVFKVSQPLAPPTAIDEARAHRDAVIECGGKNKIGPLVSWAASVSIKQQNRQEFEQLLERAIAFDVDVAPEFRLANVIAQNRARRLIRQIDDHFLSDDWEDE